MTQGTAGTPKVPGQESPMLHLPTATSPIRSQFEVEQLATMRRQ